VPRLRRIAAVARAGLPIGRHARARLSPERRDPIERRVGSEAVDTTRLDRARDERQRRPAAFAPWGVVEKKKRNLVCVSVRIDPNASAAKRAVLLRLRFGATRLGSRLKNPSRIVSVGQTDRGWRRSAHARTLTRAERHARRHSFLRLTACKGTPRVRSPPRAPRTLEKTARLPRARSRGDVDARRCFRMRTVRFRNARAPREATDEGAVRARTVPRDAARCPPPPETPRAGTRSRG
jgi:hypothetical protein